MLLYYLTLYGDLSEVNLQKNWTSADERVCSCHCRSEVTHELRPPNRRVTTTSRTVHITITITLPPTSPLPSVTTRRIKIRLSEFWLTDVLANCLPGFCQIFYHLSDSSTSTYRKMTNIQLLSGVWVDWHILSLSVRRKRNISIYFPTQFYTFRSFFLVNVLNWLNSDIICPI